jgi:hypothetical protein
MIYRMLLAILVSSLCEHVVAQESKLYLGEIVGEPCRTTSFDSNNVNRAPIPQTQFARRITKVTAVAIAGSGNPSDNEIVSRCMRTAQSRTDEARSSTHLRLYLDLYSDAFRACVGSSQRRVPIYEVSFRHEERCAVPVQ